MFDHDEDLSSASDLLEYVLKDNVLAPNGLFDVSERITSGYIYRGQAKTNWRLLPSGHRDPKVFKDFTPQPPWEKELSNNKKEYLASHVHAELRAIQLFLESADSVGLITPLDYHALTLHNTHIEEILSESGNSTNSEFPVSQFLTSAAMAQHYGVPTRLLDWTESILVAGYFAAKDVLDNYDTEDSDSRFCVICLHNELIRKTESIKIISAPRAQNPFLRAQRGLFTLVNNANQHFLENEKWPSIEDILKKERPQSTLFMKPPLIRLTLPHTEAIPLLKLLYRLKISKLTLMPSFESATEDLKYKRQLWPSS